MAQSKLPIRRRQRADLQSRPPERRLADPDGTRALKARPATTSTERDDARELGKAFKGWQRFLAEHAARRAQRARDVAAPLDASASRPPSEPRNEPPAGRAAADSWPSSPSAGSSEGSGTSDDSPHEPPPPSPETKE